MWSRLDEAGITVGIHGGDGGMGAYINGWEPMGDMEAFRSTPFRQIVSHERQISDTFSALVCHGLFDRHPNLRIASIENGGSFVPKLLEDFEVCFAKMPQSFAEDPVETFTRHVWVSPYYEDDIDQLKHLLGADHLLFGSDWPHAEGLSEPTAFIDDIAGFTAAEVQQVMRDNALALLEPVS